MPHDTPTAADLYGKGIFTTIAVSNGQPALWEKHWRRIVANASILGIDLSGHTQSTTLDSLLKVTADTGLENGRARITFFDQSPSRIWSKSVERVTELSIIVAERRRIPRDFKLTNSPHRINTTSPLVGVKSCNYLEHILAYEEATKRGFHEAIRINEFGEIASACMANVFWGKDEKLFTPYLDTGSLPGTTREFVLENIDCEEVKAGIEELDSADRIFLSSAGIGAVAVAEFDGRCLDVSTHRMTELMPWAG